MQRPGLIIWQRTTRFTTTQTSMVKEKIFTGSGPQMSNHAQMRWSLGECLQSLNNHYHRFDSLITKIPLFLVLRLQSTRLLKILISCSRNIIIDKKHVDSQEQFRRNEMLWRCYNVLISCVLKLITWSWAKTTGRSIVIREVFNYTSIATLKPN